MPKLPALFVLLASVATPALAANPHADRIAEVVAERLRPIAQEAIFVDAILAQNAAQTLSQAEIDRLDAEWMATVGTAEAPLIDMIAARPASARLVRIQDEADGYFTEIFVMDHQGMNVAMSEPTSDYWQGDEAKWQQTYAVGPDAVHVSGVTFDESAQVYQLQVSFTITGPDGAPIGAITFGIDAEQLD